MNFHTFVCFILIFSTSKFCESYIQCKNHHQYSNYGLDPNLADIFKNERLEKKRPIFEECIDNALAPNIQETEFPVRIYGDTADGVLVKNVYQYAKEMQSHINFTSEEDINYCQEDAIDDSETNHLKEGKSIWVYKNFRASEKVEINPAIPGKLTREFLESLLRLMKESANPDSSEAQAAVQNFHDKFGTHYTKSFEVGSYVAIDVLLLNPLDINTQSRLSSMVEHGLPSTFSYLQDSSPNSFARSKRMVIRGEYPSDRFNEPITLEIQKIETLLKQPWVMNVEISERFKQSYPSVTAFDGSVILDLLKRHGWGRTQRCGEGKSDSQKTCCKQNTVPNCGPSAALPNTPYSNMKNYFDGLIITGGRTLNSTLKKVTTIGIPKLPDLPEPTYGHTIFGTDPGSFAQVGGDLPEPIYGPTIIGTLPGSFAHVGGDSGGIGIDTTGRERQWTTFQGWGFRGMKYHTSTNLDGVSPMHVMDGVSLKTGPSGSTETYNLPFNVTKGHCAVDNGKHVFYIGVGEKKNEIWVNFESINFRYLMTNFKIINVLSHGRRDHRCLWTGSKIFVTGGNIGTETNPQMVDTVDIIDTMTGSVTKGAKLRTKRAFHGIIVWEGRPTVFGGLVDSGNGQALASTSEYYVEETNTWRELPNDPFGNHGHSFAYVQFYSGYRKPSFYY